MKKVLVVEDSRLINNLISKKVKKLNYEVFQAFSLSEAKSILEKENIDIVILDLHLPDGEGIDIINRINKKNAKIIILSADKDISLREELFKKGIVDYIIKDENLLYSLKEVLKLIKNIDKEKGKILVIDDSNFIQKQIKTALEARNYKITSAFSGEEAKEMLKNKYDLILLDMELPDMHGIELIKYIRKISDIPIIVLSAYLTSELIRDILKKGANDFLKKPFVFEELILRIDLWVEYYQKDKELHEKNKELNELNNNLKIKVQEAVKAISKKESLLSIQFKEAQMGEIMRFLIHQWKQPLNVISIAVSSMEMEMNLRNHIEIYKNFLEKIKSSVDYLSKTMNDFKNYFSVNKKKTQTSLYKVVKKVLNILEPIIYENNIDVKVEIKNDIEIETYENDLIQVIINIISNAIDALKIKEDRKIKIIIDNNKIMIEDNGRGIPEDKLDKIFEKEFTTKKDGTGLGLYMSKIIVENRLNGKIYVQNIKEGARFIIELPF